MNRILVFTLSMFFVFSCSKDDGPTVEQCNKPTNIQVTNTTHENATISWDSSNEAATFSVEYGISGFTQGSGTAINSTSNNVTINNLTGNTTYDFYITANCGNNNLSLPTNVNNFTTSIPPCETPSNIEVLDITFESVTINWDDSNSNSSFNIEYGISGFMPGSGTTVTSATTSISISGLNAETTYDLYITTDCGDNNISIATDVSTFSTLQPPVVAQFLTNLSELNIYNGDLANLTPSDYAFEYDLVTPLFTDYAYKQRLLALPIGTSLDYQDDGLPDFPENTVIAKTFYYYSDESDLNSQKIIIETRILIKINGQWETGNYKWNDEQTEATLTLDGHIVPTTYTNASGGTVNLNYEIPSNTDCFTCHNINNTLTPIGPKIRTLNFNGQLQAMIDANLITNISSEGDATSLPNWEDDTTFTLDERARAYLDVNCAHCHQPGGDCADESSLDFRYETRFNDTFIFDFKESIFARMISYYIDGYGMPLIGTTTLHQEGFDLIDEYIDSL